MVLFSCQDAICWITLLQAIGCCHAILFLYEVIVAILYLYGPHSYLSDVLDPSCLVEKYMNNPDTCFWVAELKDSEASSSEIIGTLAIGQKSTETSILSDDNKIAWLRRMAVKQKYRRLGVGKILVRTAIEFCVTHNYDYIELITTDIHKAAKRLYEKVGFKCVSYKQHSYFKGYLKVWMYNYVFDCHSRNAQELTNDKPL